MDRYEEKFPNLDLESRTYVALHDAMMKFYYDKKDKECVELAEKLLTKANLPLLVRARCHIMLALRRNSSLSVLHGEEGVRLLEIDLRERVKPEEFPQNQLDEAREHLKSAQEDAAKQKEKKQKKEKERASTGGAGEEAYESASSDRKHTE